MSTDVVVIGSGVGGLTAAVLCAQRGHRVTVLERHTRPGGFLHRFFRQGVGYDTGFHYVGSARPEQLFGRVLRHLGVYDALEWLPLDPDGFDELRFPGESLRVPADLGRWRDRLVARFPDERAGLDAFFDEHRAAVAAYGLYHLDVTTPPEAVLPWEERSLQAVLDTHLRDPKLKSFIGAHAVLYGVPPDEAPFGMHALVTHHFFEGAWALRGGGDKLAGALVRRLRALGGRIVFRESAAHVETEGQRATAVVTESGTRYPADLLFANVHPAALAAMVDPGVFRPAYVNRVEGARPGLAHFGVYLRVRADLSRMGRTNLYSFEDWDLRRMHRPAGPDEIPFFFLSAPGGRESGVRPGTEQVVLGLAMTTWDAWAPWQDARDPAYASRKAATLGRFLEGVRAAFPAWEILHAEASTPLTTARYTGSRFGAVYGHYHSVEQMGRHRFPIRTRLRNVLQVGQVVGFPGICGAAMTAYVAAGEVFGLPSLVEELSRS